jgi:hypothetical protein
MIGGGALSELLEDAAFLKHDVIGADTATALKEISAPLA